MPQLDAHLRSPRGMPLPHSPTGSASSSPPRRPRRSWSWTWLRGGARWTPRTTPPARASPSPCSPLMPWRCDIIVQRGGAVPSSCRLRLGVQGGCHCCAGGAAWIVAGAAACRGAWGQVRMLSWRRLHRTSCELHHAAPCCAACQRRHLRLGRCRSTRKRRRAAPARTSSSTS